MRRLNFTCVVVSFLLSTYLTPVFSQTGMWTWVKGDSTANPIGSYGILGVADPTNVPPNLYEMAWWKGSDENFWLFGGYVYPSNYASAIWKYDVSANLWTWISGSSQLNLAGNYGTMGIPSASNQPGSRCGGIATWIDSSGNFWMYGGIGYDDVGDLGTLSDLWKYDVLTNEWTWMGGDNSIYVNPDFGTYQTYSSSVNPGARGETTSAWQTDDGHFWMYGGVDFNGNSSTMWQFDPDINQWSWTWGGPAFLNINYGTLGVSGPNNSPGERMVYAHWKDLQGRLWLSGGFGGVYYSDMWMFDPLINEWTWMAGSNQGSMLTLSGHKCDTSIAHYPASRFENSASWVDHAGNFWSFGGGELSTAFVMNDLWCFQPGNNRWIWVNGDTIPEQSGSFGIQGVAASSNQPAGKLGPATWTDCESNLWMFGGLIWNVDHYDFFNDLWKFQIDPACIPFYTPISCNQSPLNFYSSTSKVCEKFCIDFFDSSANNPIAWQWIFEGGIPATSSDQDPSNICYNAAGTYDVTLITTSASGNDTLVFTDYVTVYATPPLPTITQSGYDLISSPAVSYQWQFNAVDIPGATNQSYTALQTGFYTVVVSDSNGCQNSVTLYVTISGIEDLQSTFTVGIYPNISSGIFVLDILNAQGEFEIRLMNSLGENIFSKEGIRAPDHFSKTFDFSMLQAAVYYIQVKTPKGTVVRKWVKER